MTLPTFFFWGDGGGGGGGGGGVSVLNSSRQVGTMMSLQSS